MGDIKSTFLQNTKPQNTKEKLLTQVGRLSQWVPIFIKRVEKTKFAAKNSSIEFYDQNGILEESASVWKEIFYRTDFAALINEVIEAKHETGVAFVSVQMKNGQAYPFLADSVIPSWSGRKLIRVKATFQLAIGGGVWLRIYEQSDRYKSIRRFEMIIPNDEEGEKIIPEEEFTQEQQKDVEASGWKKVWNHNLGYVPYFPIFNIRGRNNVGETDLQGNQTLLNYLDEVWIRTIWELRYNKNILDIYRQKLPGGQNKKSIGEEVETALDNYDPYVNTASAAWSQSADTNFDIKRTVSDASLQHKLLMDALTLVLEAAGYKRDSGDDGKAAQQNDTEILQLRDSEIRTFKTKQRNLEIGFQEVVKCMIDLDINPLWRRVKEIRISIPFLEVRNETSAIDNIIKMVDKGLITTVGAIAKAQEVSEAEAEAINEDIKNEKESNMPVQMNNENTKTEPDGGVNNGNTQNGEA